MGVIYNFLNKLECLLLAGLSSLVQCLWVRAGAYPIITQVCSGLSCKHWSSLEKADRAKNSSFFQILVNYDTKKFSNIGPRCQHYKTFNGRYLQIFLMSWVFATGRPFQLSPMFVGKGGAFPIVTHKCSDLT